MAGYLQGFFLGSVEGLSYLLAFAAIPTELYKSSARR